MTCTFPIKRGLWSALLLLTLPVTAAEPEPIRIQQLQRCGDLLQTQTQSFCLQVKGLQSGQWQARLNGERLAQQQVGSDGESLQLQVDVNGKRSGPLVLEQQGRQSNPVWLSLGSSHVLAATEDEVAENMDGLTSYVDLVSVVIEEEYDGLEEAERLAEKYDARVVGMIPPLNTYQLRLAAKNLDERDATVLRLGGEVSVDAVVIEESGAEDSIEADTASAPPADNEE